MKTSGEFEAQLTLARRNCADIMRARLRELAEAALKIVGEMMTRQEISPAVRLRAALAVLQSFGALEESHDDAAVIERWRRRPRFADQLDQMGV